MDETDIEQRGLNASKNRGAPCACTRDNAVKIPSQGARNLRPAARRAYIKPAFEHQIVFKQLLLKPDGTAASGR